MNKLIVCTAVLCGLLASNAAVAAPATEVYKDQIYVAPSILFFGDNDELNVNSFVAPQISIGGQFTDRLALELVYGAGDSDIDNGGPSVDADFYRLDGIWSLMAGENWKPYVAAGVGRFYLEPETGNRFKDTQLNLGLGVMRNITERLSLRGDVRAYYLTDEQENTPGMSLGLKYVFAGQVGERDSDGDGVSDPTDQCPGTPAGTRVDMNGCELDSDRDGVPNSADACPNTPAGVKVDSRGCALDSDGDGVVDHLDACPGTPRGDEVDEKGCTVKAPMPMEAVAERIELALEFDYDSSKLRPQHYAEIERVAEFMRDHPDTSAQLEGHTDSRGTEAYNLALSERRAYSVRDYLIDEADIDPRRITAVGYGEARPTASNDTDDGRQRNRRVEAVIETREMSVRQRRDN
ncbi:MAG TPA: OmpA family protein [Pseudomonadales bacterium]|nr:OmpA family protein [Pseudomonadales bacterium]